MYSQNYNYVDGLIESLKAATPLPPAAQEAVYDMMSNLAVRDRVTGPEIARLIYQLHEHRVMVDNKIGEKVLEPEKDTKVLCDATKDRVTFSVVERKRQADGTYNTLVRGTLERSPGSAWSIADFHVPQDPTASAMEKKQSYVDIGPELVVAYKGKSQQFAAIFLTELRQGAKLLGALIHADFNNELSPIIDKMHEMKPINLIPVTDGLTPWQSKYHASADMERRATAAAAPAKPKR